jgi:hypothetical protein
VHFFQSQVTDGWVTGIADASTLSLIQPSSSLQKNSRHLSSLDESVAVISNSFLLSLIGTFLLKERVFNVLFEKECERQSLSILVALSTMAGHEIENLRSRHVESTAQSVVSFGDGKRFHRFELLPNSAVSFSHRCAGPAVEYFLGHSVACAGEFFHQNKYTHTIPTTLDDAATQNLRSILSLVLSTCWKTIESLCLFVRRRSGS